MFNRSRFFDFLAVFWEICRKIRLRRGRSLCMKFPRSNVCNAVGPIRSDPIQFCRGVSLPSHRDSFELYLLWRISFSSPSSLSSFFRSCPRAPRNRSILGRGRTRGRTYADAVTFFLSISHLRKIQTSFLVNFGANIWYRVCFSGLMRVHLKFLLPRPI